MNGHQMRWRIGIALPKWSIIAVAAVFLATSSCGGGGATSGNNGNASNGFVSADIVGKAIQFRMLTSSTASEVDTFLFNSGGSVAISSSVLPGSGSWTIGSDGTLTVGYGSAWLKYTIVKKDGPYLVVNSAHSDGTNVSNVLWTVTTPFATSSVAGMVVQYTGASGLVTYMFRSDHTVAIVTSGTWLAYGTWSVGGDGRLTVTSGGSSLTFSLVQNGASYAVNYSNGSTAILNSAITLVDPSSSTGFLAGMLAGKSLELHVLSNGLPGTQVYGFNADGTVLVTTASSSTLHGTWAIQPDGTVSIGYGTAWEKYKLVGSYGTFLIVNQSQSTGSTANDITLTYTTTSTGFTSAMLIGKTLQASTSTGGVVSFTFNADGTVSGPAYPTTWVINADGTLTFNVSGYGWSRFVPVQNTSTKLTVNEIDDDGTITLDIALSYTSGQSTSVVWTPPSILDWSPPTVGGGYTPVDQVVIAGSNVGQIASSTWQFTLTYVPEDSSGTPILDSANNPTVAVTTPSGTFTVQNVATTCVQPKPAQGVGLGVIIDDSGSMSTSDPSNFRKTAVDSLIDALDPADLMALTDYENDSATPLTDLVCWAQQGSASGCTPGAASFIADKARLHAGAARINSTGASTPLYEACVQMISLVKGVAGAQQVVLLLSDGQPNGTHSTATDCINAAKDASIRVYTLGVGPAAEGTSQSDTTAVQTLRDLAQQTGGTYAAASQASSLVSLFTNMGTAMQKGSCSSVVTVKGPSVPTSGTKVAGTLAFGSTTAPWSLVVP